MALAHDVVAVSAERSAAAESAQKTALILHGILGSKNNWRRFAQKLVDAAPGWRVVAVDLRNHGESHGQPPPHTVEACADDVLETVPSFEVVIGHSYGGKVALELARRAPAALEEAWILDCPPGPRPFLGSEIENVLKAVSTVHMPLESRRDLVESLRVRGLSEPLSQWMTTNLRYVDGAGFTWRFDLKAIPEMLASFAALDLWSVVDRTDGPDIVIVRGGRSDRFAVEDLARLAMAVSNGTVTAHVLPTAGHWLHTDDPDGLLALVAPALLARG